eukprot:3173553-Pyramimonas_sp.AAC.1
MAVIRAKPIGIVRILDQGDKDDKVVSVCVDDPEFKGSLPTKSPAYQTRACSTRDVVIGLSLL